MEDSKRFVEITRAREVRLNNLNAAKEVITGVKVFHKLRVIKTHKVKLIKQLQKEMRELKLLFSKLYEFLPEHTVLEGKKKAIKTTKKGKEKVVHPNIKDSTIAIDKLEKSLSTIENRLKKI
jgi:hypothetical protein